MSSTPSTIPDGVLLIDKPTGCTSFDVVRRIKRRVRPLKVGHTGTLDPMATGLLPLTIGEATKLTGLLQMDAKRYQARIRLGLATDTLDASGQPVERQAVPPLDEDLLRGVLSPFIGEIDQVPPMYSALHHEGRRLHALARSGKEVDRPPRRVRIHHLDLLQCGPDWFDLDVGCGSGTYVRSLAADLAVSLGTVGHLEALRRTETSGWRVEDAVGLDALEDARILSARILPLEEALARFQRIDVPDDLALRLAQGHRLSWNQLKEIGISEVSAPTWTWFRPASARPVILARLLPPPEEPGMEIKRVLCPERAEQLKKH